MTMHDNPVVIRPPPKTPKLGGLNHLERFLGLRHDSALSTDAVFVSLDLEVASNRRTLHLSAEKPVIRQLAFACLDTPDLNSLSTFSDLKDLITVKMFESEVPPEFKKLARAKKRQCVFTQTQSISQEQVSTIVAHNLRIADNSDKSGGSCLRDIILVGHSIRADLRILRLLDIEIFSIAPIFTFIDTYKISRLVLPTLRPNLSHDPKQQDLSLAGVLAELGCRPDKLEFHNAGNDAVYTLYAMLLLAVKKVAARTTELRTVEVRTLETIRQVAGSAALACSLSSNFLESPTGHVKSVAGNKTASGGLSSGKGSLDR